MYWTRYALLDQALCGGVIYSDKINIGLKGDASPAIVVPQTK